MQDPPDEARQILVVAAHPDDAEIGCGGTVARWAAEGHRVHYVICTMGEKASYDPATTSEQLVELRQREQEKAASHLGVVSTSFLKHAQGELVSDLSLRQELVLAIRRTHPHTVVTHDPWRLYQAYPDHRVAGLSALEASTVARYHLWFPEHLRNGLSPHRVREVYFFTTDHPNVWVDISATLQAKIEALRFHQTQVFRMKELEERVTQWARTVGQARGMEYGEEFHRIDLG